MQYSEAELSELIKSLEVEFSAHIAEIASAASLAKSEDEEEEKKELPSEEEKEEKNELPTEEVKEEVSAEEEKPSEDAPVKPPVEDNGPYSPEEIAHIDAMYMSMSKEELLAHHDSCVKALDAIGAEHKHSAPAPEEKPEVEKCGDMTMSKSENQELELAKSEAAANKAKVEELQKSLEAIQEFLTTFVKKVPQGKAITSLEQISKSELVQEEKQLSKSEITAILTKRAADPMLSKSDREAINAYYLNQTNLKTISHLLK